MAKSGTERTEQRAKALYLGDGLYATHDGFNICLFTDNGMVIDNEVFLEPSVLTQFLEYVERIRGSEIPNA